MICFVTYHPAAVLHGQRRGPEYAQNLDTYITQDLANLKNYHGVLDSPPEAPPNPQAILSLDTEYEGEELLTIGLSDGINAYAWDLKGERGGPRNELLAQPKELLESTTYLIGHNVPEDIDKAIAAGVLPLVEEFISGAHVVDTLLVARMVDENRMSYELEDLTAALFPITPWKFKTERKNGATRTAPNVDQERDSPMPSSPEVQGPEEA